MVVGVRETLEGICDALINHSGQRSMRQATFPNWDVEQSQVREQWSINAPVGFGSRAKLDCGHCVTMTFVMREIVQFRVSARLPEFALFRPAALTDLMKSRCAAYKSGNQKPSTCNVISSRIKVDTRCGSCAGEWIQGLTEDLLCEFQGKASKGDCGTRNLKVV